MEKRIAFCVIWMALMAWAQDAPVQVADTLVKPAENVTVDTTKVVKDTVVNIAKENIAEPIVDTVADATPKKDTTLKSDTIRQNDTTQQNDSTQSSGGLLGALYPIDKTEAIAKGRVFGGATLSLIQAETDDDAMNVIIGDVYEAEGYMFTVEAFGGYFIKDALAIGLRAGYSRTWLDIDFALLEDLLDVAEHRKYESNGFFVQPFLKNYLKVFDSRILYFFNETSLLVEYSYGISQNDDGEDMSKTRNKMWTIKFGLNPGLCIMVLDRVAFETSVGLLGLSSSIVEVEENGEKHSKAVFNMVNFTINLLALDFSLVYFF